MAQKILIIGIIAMAGTLSGIFLQQKFFNESPEQIDYERIRKIVGEEIKQLPTPTVSVQPFDVEKIKGVREFNYSPAFSGNVTLSGCDSTAMKRLVESAVDKALSNYRIKRK
ncbi:MAG: hypothetical protein ACK52I_22225 [Pseudomonadota bacterium]|jgi:hypothetical protein